MQAAIVVAAFLMFHAAPADMAPAPALNPALATEVAPAPQNVQGPGIYITGPGCTRHGTWPGGEVFHSWRSRISRDGVRIVLWRLVRLEILHRRAGHPYIRSYSHSYLSTHRQTILNSGDK